MLHSSSVITTNLDPIHTPVLRHKSSTGKKADWELGPENPKTQKHPSSVFLLSRALPECSLTVAVSHCRIPDVNNEVLSNLIANDELDDAMNRLGNAIVLRNSEIIAYNNARKFIKSSDLRNKKKANDQGAKYEIEDNDEIQANNGTNVPLPSSDAGSAAGKQVRRSTVRKRSAFSS